MHNRPLSVFSLCVLLTMQKANAALTHQLGECKDQICACIQGSSTEVANM